MLEPAAGWHAGVCLIVCLIKTPSLVVPGMTTPLVSQIITPRVK
jgi:hypothetical protein